MLTDNLFRDILSGYNVNAGLWEHFRDALRGPIEDAINACFSERPNYRYGGSLAKGTANKNSCDVDLLVYFDSDFDMSVAVIYKTVAKALREAGYIFVEKNSAIKVLGKNHDSWGDISVDVVPGKYSSGGDEKDVYLYLNRDNARLKSNPEKQIRKIQGSDMKEVIRIIKLLREARGFEFKSFFLELFAVDIVEPNLSENSSLVEKLIQFAKRFAEIGVSKVYDPANPNGNNIMDIHSEYEFQLIRKYIKTLYEVLLTDDESLVKDYLTGKGTDQNIQSLIESAYAKSAKSHSPSLQLTIGYAGSPALSLTCRKVGASDVLQSGQTINKETYLRFEIAKSSYYSGYHFTFVVSNAGYEARVADQLRGKSEEPDRGLSNSVKFIREEHTLYNGNHYVQAIGTHPNKENLYSVPFVVRVRDFE